MAHEAGRSPDAPPEAFTDYTSREALPEPVDASSGRSPNRKPRVRRQLKLWETRQAKKLFLLTYKLSGDAKLACERVGLHRTTIWRWMKDAPAFKAEFVDLAAGWQEMYRGELRNMTMKSIEVLGGGMDHRGRDERLALEAAKIVLKSQGLCERSPSWRTHGRVEDPCL